MPDGLIILNSGDKIQGDASAAAVIDYTIHGLDNNCIRRLADGQLPNATGDLYTSDSVDVVSAIILVNTDTAARTVNLFLLPSGGTARRLIPKDMILGAGYSLFFDGAKCTTMNTSGQVVGGYSLHAADHRSGGSDDLLSAPGAIGGTTPAAGSFTDLSMTTQAISDNAIVTVDQIGAADNDYAKFTANGIEGRSYAEVRSDLNVEDGAEANNIPDADALDLTDGGDTTLHYHATDRARANHTGTQTASTISDFDEAAQDAVGGMLVDSSEIDFTYTDATPSITASLIVGSIDVLKLDAGVQASLALADSSSQPGDNISGFTNDSGFISSTGVTYENLSANGDIGTTASTVAAGDDSRFLNSTQKTDLTDSGDSSLHYHSADRNRANHTGTQTAATIRDFDTEVSNNTDVAANTGSRHTQNTDTGTTSSTFQIGSGGPKLKNSSGTLQARNAADDDFALVDNGPTVANAIAAITSFSGTISASSTTAIFSETADYNLCKVGSTLIADGDTRVIIALLGSNQVTLDYITRWAASTAITSLQDPIVQHKDSSGNVLYFSAATGDQAWLDTSGNVDIWKDKDGNLGVGETSPREKLVVSATGYDARVTVNGDGVLGSAYPGLELKHSGSEYVRSLIRSDYQNPGTKLSFWTGTTGTTNPTEKMVIDQNGNVLIGTTTSTSSMMTLEGSLSLKEQAAADAATAGYGEIVVINTTPNELWFYDDTGTGVQLSSHPLDAPTELYTNGPGLDWMGKRVQHYLGEIYWQTIDGKITIDTFDEYNARRKDISGHVDLVQLDWDEVHTEQAIKKYQAEEIEIGAGEAIEEVEIVEKVKEETIETMYVLDEETGEIALSEQKVPVFVDKPTGKIGKRLKDGVRLDSETGKLYRKRTSDEAAKMVTEDDIPAMPEWMRKRRIGGKNENIHKGKRRK